MNCALYDSLSQGGRAIHIARSRGPDQSARIAYARGRRWRGGLSTRHHEQARGPNYALLLAVLVSLMPQHSRSVRTSTRPMAPKSSLLDPVTMMRKLSLP